MTRREYDSGDDDLGGLPLFGEIQPPCSPANDPPSALEAAASPEAQRALVKGTARCCMILLTHQEGLTNNEIVDQYHRAYPEEIDQRGVTGFVHVVTRNWCMLKPNEDTRNHQHKNLALIQRTEQYRINPHSNRRNVVFQFINPPTEAQRQQWAQLAEEESLCIS